MISFNQRPVGGGDFNQESSDPSSRPVNLQPDDDQSFSWASDEDSLYRTGDFSHAVFKYINDILMEEDLEDEPPVLQDSLAVQAAEKSFYDALGQKYPPSSSSFPPFTQQIAATPDANFTSTTSSAGSCYSNSTTSNFAESYPISNQCELECSDVSNFPESDPISNQCEFECSFAQSSHVATPESSSPFRDFRESLVSYEEFANNSFQYKNPVNFSPMMGNSSMSPSTENEKMNLSNGSKGRKHHQCEDSGCSDDERRNKQSVGCSEELEQLELIDKTFLVKVVNRESIPCPLYDESRNKASRILQNEELLQASNTRIRRMTKRTEMVDLWTLLTQCAQAAGSGDQRTAYKVLTKIRQHSSPFGDANQRLAHYFANGLDARLAGPGRLYCTPSAGNLATAADILKAYQLYVSITPFRKMTNTLANRTIARVADKVTRLHVIDFGIAYGFQWPCFIHRLSTRPGGPPKIRFTGIDLPQPGFRPAERVEETGRRLKRLAERLNVPFEYNAIAQRWETIRYEDLKIDRDEMIAVNCMMRLKNLPDDTIVANSPRDVILKLIKQVNPDIFLHGVVNASYNAPTFSSRFREAMFYFSAFFDMFEATTTREDQERLVFEREEFGKEIMNVAAFEGLERVERPETYKQWQARIMRIGFRQVPFHQDIVRRARNIISDYHKDFVFDEDGHWALMGWKGRIVRAISAWKPVQD
ncbi:hypothetical protein K2173_015737 [Erythroxylum novogranatense]|uniref:Uncharacterized protein n=1 Tax=Erythroxylum novogranatense TaxID=1862640 RepID=A0AAV8SEB5_9ROSI|nr:hypothetical protein K2173_015737 [Erythroxylum novogranatense]